MELRKDVTFEEDVAYWRSRHADNDSDDSQELLASPYPPSKRETMEDDIVEPTDPVDLVVLNPIPREIAVMGQKRRLAWAH